MRTHTANGIEIACRRETAGSCRICELTDPDSPSYRADYARLYSGATTHTVTAAVPVPDIATTYGIPLAGDLVAALTKRMGIDWVVKTVAEELGVPCGCDDRRVKLNALDAKFRRFLGW
jgi:hypothetical protein